MLPLRWFPGSRRGPVDWPIVEFRGSWFKGEIARTITDLVNREIIRIFDLLVLHKDDAGQLEVSEITDLDNSR